MKVVPGDLVSDDSAPWMWMFDGVRIPFAYTTQKLGSKEPPTVPGRDFNLGLRWLNFGGVEETDEKRRMQWVKTSKKKPALGISTMLNYNEGEGSRPMEETNCPYKMILIRYDCTTCEKCKGGNEEKHRTVETRYYWRKRK